jgi:membrane associated rhomboid family serine protease
VFPLRDNIPTEATPYVTAGLILLNVLAYFLWQHGGLTLGDPTGRAYVCNLADYAAVPKELTQPGFEIANCGGPHPVVWITPFTAMFMHGGLLHLGGNMLFLWIFGNNVEDAMGPVKFLLFYVIGGLCALGLQVAIDPGSTVPTIGASGAIAAVLGGYIVLHPRARVLTVIFIIFFFTLVEIPALFVLGIWFLEQVAFGYFGLNDPTGNGGGVAYFAHIGGFVFGLLTIRLWVAGRGQGRRGLVA